MFWPLYRPPHNAVTVTDITQRHDINKQENDHPINECREAHGRDAFDERF